MKYYRITTGISPRPAFPFHKQPSPSSRIPTVATTPAPIRTAAWAPAVAVVPATAAAAAAAWTPIRAPGDAARGPSLASTRLSIDNLALALVAIAGASPGCRLAAAVSAAATSFFSASSAVVVLFDAPQRRRCSVTGPSGGNLTFFEAATAAIAVASASLVIGRRCLHRSRRTTAADAAVVVVHLDLALLLPLALAAPVLALLVVLVDAQGAAQTLALDDLGAGLLVHLVSLVPLANVATAGAGAISAAAPLGLIGQLLAERVAALVDGIFVNVALFFELVAQGKDAHLDGAFAVVFEDSLVGLAQAAGLLAS